ncbi:coiled-coil domain-containing protein 112 [Thalassophryne amazonica]|uniref:coiled-coil domain-containing protein 112 n=1 Tax=Thalassophryne amazonica TaxID=390379 RepID=UPI00147123B3|nr:coiled-coil domain-containing protein 112 [Thalassophryne amazonica]
MNPSLTCVAGKSQRFSETSSVHHYSHVQCSSVVSSPVCRDGADGKVSRQEAAQFLSEADKLKRQIEKLEKDRTLQWRKNGCTDVSGELDEYENVLEAERNVEKFNYQKQLVKIQNGVKKFQRQLIDVKPTPELIERLKEIMTEVANLISTFKEEQRSRFEELLKEEKMCQQEITAYEKIENWNLVVKLDSKPCASSTVKIKPVDREHPVEVRALESFLQRTGGACGGWDQYDHQTFLKVWMKHSGQPAYRSEAKLHLPGKTLEEIEQHEDWHQKLIHLQDRKREAIQRWKASKQQNRQQQEEAETERTEREAKRQAQQHRAERERMEVSHRLKEWREERKKKEEEREKQRLAEELHKRRQAKEERHRQLEVKLIIEEQLRQQTAEKEEEKRRRQDEEQKASDKRRKEATKSIKHFSERDLHKLETKLQEKQLREQQVEERQKRIAAKFKEKVDSHVSSDPSRLTRPTKGWEERVKHVGSSGGGPMLQMFHRAVPTWRQGL